MKIFLESLTNIYQIKFMIVCEIIYVIYMGNFVAAFFTTPTAFLYSNIPLSGHNLDGSCTQQSTHICLLDIRRLLFPLNLLYKTKQKP